jgi:hypothetical protein
MDGCAAMAERAYRQSSCCMMKWPSERWRRPECVHLLVVIRYIIDPFHIIINEKESIICPNKRHVIGVLSLLSNFGRNHHSAQPSELNRASTMGNEASSPDYEEDEFAKFEGIETLGYRVLGVQPNSPASGKWQWGCTPIVVVTSSP